VDLLANRDRPRGYLLQELQAIVQQAQLSVIDVRPSEQEATIDPVFERAWAQFWQVPTSETASETAGKTTGEMTGEITGEAATIEPHEATGEATNEATTIEDLSSLGLNQTSLNTSLKIPYYILRAWNSSQLPQRLLVQTLLISTMASDRVRVYQPDRLLNSIPGARTSSSLHQLLLSRGRSDESKVFIWQRARLNRADGIQKQRRILDAGYLTVVEIDDDPRFWQEHIDEDFFTYRSCHCIQTSTEPLADFLRQFNPYVFIMPNQIYELPLPRVYDEAQPVKVFFGALNREEDWQPLMAGINRTLRDLGDRVFVQVVHDKLFYQFLDTPYKGFEATCTYDRYHEILRDCDLALLPLNPTEFNTMKSDLKFIECASRGVVVLASPTVYARSVQHGKTGLLFNTPEEFEVLLHQVIDNRVWRRELAANAYAYVRDRRMISQHYRDRYNWYLEMLDRLPELNAALKERVPEIFADLGI
jgi:glycosyltransferase involved in cell wall biosynthesis